MPEEENSWNNWDVTSQFSRRDVMSCFASITLYPGMGGVNNTSGIGSKPQEFSPKPCGFNIQYRRGEGRKQR